MAIQKISKEVLLRYRYPEAILKEKYKILNYVLAGIIGVFIISKIFLYKTIYVILSASGLSGSALLAASGMTFIINTAMLILMIWIFKLLFSFDARAYYFAALLSIISLSNITKLDVLGFVLVIISLILSLYLKKKLFPNISIWAFVPKQ